MDEIVQALYAIGEPGWFDYVNAGATLFLSFAALRASHIIANKQNKIALTEKRYALYQRLSDLLMLGEKLRSFSEPAKTSESFTLKDHHFFLNTIMLEHNPTAAQDAQNAQDSISTPGAPNDLKQVLWLLDSLSETARTGLLGTLVDTCKQLAAAISPDELLYAKTCAFSTEPLLLHVLDFKRTINQAPILFPQINKEKFSELVTAYERYASALIDVHAECSSSILNSPEAKLQQSSMLPIDSQRFFSAYSGYFNAHRDIDLQGIESTLKEDSQRLLDCIKELNDSVEDFTKLCQEFEKEQLPIMQKEFKL